MKKLLLLFFIISFINNIQAQNAGIGTTTPHSSSLLEVRSSSGGLLLPRLTNAAKNNIANPPDGLTIFNSTFSRFEQYNGTGWKNFLDQDYWARTGNHVYTLDDVGLGTAAPSEKLEVVGNIRLRGDVQLTRYSGTANNIDFRFSGASSNNLTQGFFFKIGGDNRSFLTFRHSDAAGEDKFRFGFYNGTYGEIKSSGDFIFNALSNPILQLNSTGVVEKGFLQLSGDDFRVGTNSSNTAGEFYFRLNGGNRVRVANNGFMKIGGGTPTTRLDVEGNVLSNGDFTSNGGNLVTNNITVYNEIQKPGATGSYSLIPVAYGRVDYDGSIISATPNVSVTRVSQGVYDIVVNGITSSCTIIAYGGETTTATYFTTNTCRVINHKDVFDGNENVLRTDTRFYFIIFQP